MKFLLDTHAFVWLVGDETRFRPITRASLGDVGNELYLSVASLWEMATKARLGRFPEAIDLLHDLDDILERFEIKTIPISRSHAMEAGMLPGPHRDPFDRMLIAQSILERMPIVTKDAAFDNYNVKVIW
jgi:PIN domain nuclease of toxin-antitoxin system